MRIVVFLLALMAAAKVVASEVSYRNTMKEAVIIGHRERAAQACHRDGKTLSLQASPQVWGRPKNLALVMGNPQLDATAWDVDSPAWASRYRNPNLVLRVELQGGVLTCSFDVVTGTAVVGRG